MLLKKIQKSIVDIKLKETSYSEYGILRQKKCIVKMIVVIQSSQFPDNKAMIKNGG